ncbi:MAG TPA: methyltransferase domain-containing protein [Holophagaceae bacterium]|nr:methyltransferase domain-containing protein [Holophagaceae bacterium]
MLGDGSGYHYFEDINWGLVRLWKDLKGLEVLDVGCGFATTSQLLREQGNRITGIEENPGAVEVARTRLDEVIQGNLADLESILGRLDGRRFDAIIFADVLEHLPWPRQVLEGFLPLLKPGGSVFISLPNVGLWSVRLGLLLGRFDYQDTGVLDRTHLRFFTRKSVAGLLAAAGLEPEAWTYTPGLVRPFIPLLKRLMGGGPPDPGTPHDPRALLDSRAYGLYRRFIHPPERLLASMLPGPFAFQMVVQARRGPRS